MLRVASGGELYLYTPTVVFLFVMIIGVLACWITIQPRDARCMLSGNTRGASQIDASTE